MPNFQEYERARAPRSSEPAVTLTKYGVIGLNQRAYRLLGEPAYVTLLYARDERIVGIRPAREDSRRNVQGKTTVRSGAYKVRANGKSSKAISAIAFFKWAGIEGDSCPRSITLQDGTGCIDLKQPGL